MKFFLFFVLLFCEQTLLAQTFPLLDEYGGADQNEETTSTVSTVVPVTPTPKILPLQETELAPPASELPPSPQIIQEGKVYGMADLDVLKSEKNYKEFFAHALDIRPSERVGAWKEYVLSLAQSYLREGIARSDFSTAFTEQLQQLSLWPVLHEDEFFMSLRDDYAKKYFPHCLQMRVCTVEEMKEFWKLSPQKPTTGIELARLALTYQKENDLSVSDYLGIFFEKIPYDDFAVFHCKDSLVQEVFFAQLIKKFPALQEEKKETFLFQKIKSEYGPDCWQSLALGLKEYLYEGSGYLQKMAYLTLSLLKGLTEADHDYYQTLYLLEGPIPGPLFNEAWNRLGELKRHYLRRMKTLEALMKRKVMPGKVLLAMDKERKKIILNYFASTFPEYLENYIKACLKAEQNSYRMAFEQSLHCKELREVIREELIPIGPIKKVFLKDQQKR